MKVPPVTGMPTYFVRLLLIAKHISYIGVVKL